MKKCLLLLICIVFGINAYADEFSFKIENMLNNAMKKGFSTKTVAVLKFDFANTNNNNSKSVQEEILKIVKHNILNSKSNLILVGRDVLDKIEKEVYEKELDGFTDRKTSARIGEGLGVKGIISGTIKYKPELKNTHITIELTDTETHEVISSEVIITDQFNYELDNSILIKENAVKALTFSTIIPGLGQMSKGHSLRGSLFFAAEAGLIAGALIANGNISNASSDRDNPENISNWDFYNDRANKWKNIRLGFFIGATAIHLYNMYDAYAVSPVVKNLSTAVLLDKDKMGISLAYQF